MLRGEKKTSKHKQLRGIVPEMGGGQTVYVFPLFLGKRETHKQNVPGNLRKRPGESRDSPGIIPGQSRDDFVYVKGRKKHINFFNINFLAPTQNLPFWAPRKKFMCLISWQRTQKRDPHKLFRGDLGGQKRGPKQAIFGHKKFCLLLFSCPYMCFLVYWFFPGPKCTKFAHC